MIKQLSAITLCSVTALGLSVYNQQSARSASITSPFNPNPYPSAEQISNIVGTSSVVDVVNTVTGLATFYFQPASPSGNFSITGPTAGPLSEFTGGSGSFQDFSVPLPSGGTITPSGVAAVFNNPYPGGTGGAEYIPTSQTTVGNGLIDIPGGSVFSASSIGTFQNINSLTDPSGDLPLGQTISGSALVSATFSGLTALQVLTIAEGGSAAGVSCTQVIRNGSVVGCGISTSWSATFTVSTATTPEASMVPGLALLAGSAIFLRKKGQKQ